MREKNRKNKNYYGLTIIEMLVAIAIFAMGMAGFTLLFMKVWQTNSYTLEMGQSAMEVSQGVNKMASYIREAQQGADGSYPLVSSEDNNLVFYSDYDKDGVVERLHFYKNGQDVMMGIADPTTTMPKTYPSGDEEVETLARTIVNNSTTPIFYYYNQNYPADTSNNPMANPVDFSIVRLVKIYLQININPARAPDNIEMQTFVELRNLNK